MPNRSFTVSEDSGNEAQYLFIHLPWGGEQPGINFCFVCGAKLWETEGCAHRLFTFNDEGGEFENVAERIQDLVDAFPDVIDEEDDRSYPEILTAMIRRTGVVCLHTSADSTGGGMAVCFELETSEEA